MIGEVIKITWKKILRTSQLQVVILLAYLLYCLYLIFFAGSAEQGAANMGLIFAFLSVLLSGGLIRDEFESREIDPLVVRFKISDLFWGKFLSVITLILLSYILVAFACLIGLVISHEWSDAGQILKLLGRQLVPTIYICSAGFFLACLLKGVMNFVSIILIEVAASFALEKFFQMSEQLERSQPGTFNLATVYIQIFMPGWRGNFGWQLIYLLIISALLVFLSYVVFKSMATKNNLQVAPSPENGGLLAIRVRGLKKTYKEGFLNRKGKEALKGVDFSIPRNKLTGFLGPNGAGKTTTLRIILNLLKPQAGEVIYIPEKAKPLSAANPKIGYLQESASLYPFLTVKEMLLFAARGAGLSRSQASELVPTLVDKLGLSEHLNRRIKTLSKGTVQKVAFGVATIGQPDILIFDEPYTGLDPIIMYEIRNLILELKARGTTIFLSSHILPEVERVCDAVVLINKGKIVCSGEIEKLKTSWRVYQLLKRKEELTSRLSEKLGENLTGVNFSYFARLNLEPVLQDESLTEELKQIPSPDMEKLFLDSVVSS
ncbi:MAG TPA: ABC transporter ATP-binding protein [Candidatus Saccharicenans sp.]|nr:ABC transporter ATP-binding protein [Candidatus Saccharicenans sp.]